MGGNMVSSLGRGQGADGIGLLKSEQDCLTAGSLDRAHRRRTRHSTGIWFRLVPEGLDSVDVFPLLKTRHSSGFREAGSNWKRRNASVWSIFTGDGVLSN
jgi:hypothetical protein